MLKINPSRNSGKKVLMFKFLFLVLFGVMVVSLMGYGGNYLDVGNDPMKLYVKKITRIEVSERYQFEAFSITGNYIGFTYGNEKEKKLETIICNKDGKFYKRLNGIGIIKWVNDDNKIIGYDFTKNIIIFDIRTGKKRILPINFNNTKGGTYNMFRNSFMFVYEGKDNELYEYDIEKGKINFLYNSNYKEIKPIALSKNEIGYLEFKFKKSTIIKIWRVNLRNKKKTKIYEFESSYPYAYSFYTRNKKAIVIFEKKNGYICIGDMNGNLLFRVKIRIWDDEDRGIRTIDQLDYNYLALSPNGKILAISSVGMSDFEESDEGVENVKYEIADIVILNSSNKNKVKFLPEEGEQNKHSYELVKAWSPSGDRIIYLDAKDNRYYIMKIGVKR